MSAAIVDGFGPPTAGLASLTEAWGHPVGGRLDFDAFYVQMRQPATRYAATILGQRRHAELPDVLQEAWIRAWRAWDSADPERREAWLLRIVRNCAIDRHRRQRDLESLGEGEPELLITIDFDEGLRAEEAMRLLETLPRQLRETLWLRVVQDLAYAEIAELLDIPVGTVMSRLHSARRKLSRRMSDTQ